MCVKELKEFCMNVCLVDIWRKIYGFVIQCIWFNVDKFIGLWLDKFFIVKDLVINVIKCEILLCVFFDYDFVDLIFDVENVFFYGFGVWRLNLVLF